MKSVTEFISSKLVKGIEAQTALAAEGKTPEEVEMALGESFKFEGNKLKHFVNSMTVAADNRDKLSRILVVSIDEGESIPTKAVQIEEYCYIPEFAKAAPAPVLKKPEKGAGGPKKGKKKSGPRPSPWGESPEEIEAKKTAKRKADQKKSASS